MDLVRVGVCAESSDLESVTQVESAIQWGEFPVTSLVLWAAGVVVVKRLLETVTVFREEDVNRLFVQPRAVVWSSLDIIVKFLVDWVGDKEPFWKIYQKDIV